MNDIILEKLRELILQVVPNLVSDEVTYETALQADLGIDSIVMVEIIIAIEEAFNFEFDELDLHMDNFLDITTICKFICHKHLKA
jgi:acyl carrier protein